MVTESKQPKQVSVNEKYKSLTEKSLVAFKTKNLAFDCVLSVWSSAVISAISWCT